MSLPSETALQPKKRSSKTRQSSPYFSLLDSTGQLAEVLEFARRYFDFAAFVRDLELSGNYSFVPANGQVYAYANQ